jgi:hypothetical protein
VVNRGFFVVFVGVDAAQTVFFINSELFELLEDDFVDWYAVIADDYSWRNRVVSLI